jgi:hypothetical protein
MGKRMMMKDAKDTYLLNLHPDHLKDLQKSGLSAETIKEADIYSVPPRDINKKLGINAPKIESLLCFPYPGCNGFERYKVFPVRPKGKYLQPRNSKNHLYISQKIWTVLQDVNTGLYLTEGEKKTLKAIQEGLFCIGVSGWWNWKNKGSDELIPDFDLIRLDGRKITLVPDNDWQSLNKHGYRKNIKQAIYRLSKKLVERGARVFIKDIPAGAIRRQWR